MSKRSITVIINDYVNFVKRKFEGGYSYSQVLLMAYSYLDCLSENGLIDWDTHCRLMRYVDIAHTDCKGVKEC